MISYGRQYLDKTDISSVAKTLKSNLITQGPQVKKFEKILKKKFGSKYCAVVSSGTAALHLAAISLGWKSGDIILTTPISFLATSNCILYTNATPYFIDISETNYNIDVIKLERKIDLLKKKKKRIKAIIATDFAGQPCNWKKLKLISKKHNLTLINDNCHAIGASYLNNKNYAIKYADLVTHSYHPVKHFTTGEGGAVFTNNYEIHKKIILLRSHGVSREANKLNRNGSWYYEMNELGYNYRITDFQCSLGISQVKKLDKFITKRRKIAKIYDRAFANDKRFIIPKIDETNKHSYHIYPLLINFRKLKIKKVEFFKKMLKKKISLQVHYIPIHLQPFYKKKLKYKKGDFPVSEKFYEKEVSLPIYYSLKEKNVYKVINLIKKFCH